MPHKKSLSSLIQVYLPEMSPTVREKVLTFYTILKKENESQNLTRWITEIDFFQHHLWDAWKVFRCASLKYPAVDLGSGCGVPGLLAALFIQDTVVQQPLWFLIESKSKKAQYLKKTAQILGVPVEVILGRIEAVLPALALPFGSVVCRALGTVSTVYPWIRMKGQNCSTWNNWILLKGPLWEIEWNAFQKTTYSSEVFIQEVFSYTPPITYFDKKCVVLSPISIHL